MSTTAQLLALRATAVSEYQSARDAFKTKYIALAALDRALTNGNVAYTQTMPSFGGVRREMIALMQHPTAGAFLPGDWEADIAAAANVHVAAFPTPDE